MGREPKKPLSTASEIAARSHKLGVGGLAKRQRCDDSGGQRRDQALIRIGEHSSPDPSLITLNRKSIELVLLVVDGLREGVILWLRFGPRLG